MEPRVIDKIKILLQGDSSSPIDQSAGATQFDEEIKYL